MKTKWSWSGFANALLLVGLSLVAFGPSLSNDWIWDDDYYITENPTLYEEGGLRDIWMEIFPPATPAPQYYPLVYTTFWLEYRLWGQVPDAKGAPGPNPFGYHLDNILLHAFSAILLWRILLNLAVPGAWLVAAVFAVHPVMVESVAWATERKNVLSMLFALAAAWCWLRWVRLLGSSEEETATTEDPSKRYGAIGWYLLAILLFMASLLSKSVTASLPAVLALVLWWKRGRFPLIPSLSLLGLLIPGAIYSYVVTVQLERDFVGADRIYWDYNMLERSLVAAKCVWIYAAKLVRPYPLIFFYERWEPDASDLVQYLFLAGAIILPLGLWVFRKKLGRGPLTGILIFGGVLFPALGFLNVYPHRFSWVADHFQYHASLGFLILAVSGAATFVARKGLMKERAPAPVSGPVQGGWSIPLFALAIPLLGVFSFLSWQQCRIYENAEVLWRSTIEDNPQAYAAHNNLASIHFERGDFSPALYHYQEGLKNDSKNLMALVGIGQILINTNRLNDAIPFLEKAFELHPDTAHANYTMSLLKLNQGEYSEVIPYALEALRIEPSLALARLNLGLAYYYMKDYPVAYEELGRTVHMDGNSVPARTYYAACLARLGRTSQAIAELQTALTMQSSFVDALIFLSFLYSSHEQEQIRNPQEALRLARSACQLSNFRNYEALDALAAAQAATGNFQGAQSTIQQAISVAPRSERRSLRTRQTLYRRDRDHRSPTGMPKQL